MAAYEGCALVWVSMQPESGTMLRQKPQRTSKKMAKSPIKLVRSKPPKASKPPKPTIRIHYIKSPTFRTIHLDGAIGGVTPNGHIHMAVYNERPAIPREQVFELSGEGLGPIVDTVGREGIVREMDVDILMSLREAKSVRNWLTRNIRKLEARMKKAETDKSS